MVGAVDFKSLLGFGSACTVLVAGAVHCTLSCVTQNYGSCLALFANTGFGAASIPQLFIIKSLFIFYYAIDYVLLILANVS
jgi:hypothetical protein